MSAAPRLVAALAAAALSAGCGPGGESPHPGAGAPAATPRASEAVSVRDAWVLAAPPVSENSAAYLELVNASGAEVRLVGAASPAARAVELHHVLREGGRARMRPTARIVVPPRGTAVLEPGGSHVMLIGLVRPLVAGATVPLVLRFSDGDSLAIEAPVRRP